MSWLKKLSIRRKLALILMSISVVSALLACTLFGLYDWTTSSQPAINQFLNRIAFYGKITAVIFFSSAIVALIFSFIFQRWIAYPILALAKTVRRVTALKDYSMRATRISQDEIGELTDGFNHMLQGIETREKFLQQSNEALKKEVKERQKVEKDLRLLTETLEQRVSERTAAAESANQSKSNFLTNVSHELRTPLNSVIGFTNLLLKNKANNLRADDLAYLERVLSNGRHLLGLINQLLDLSKIEAQKSELTLAPVSLSTLIKDVLSECESMTAGRPIKLVLSAPSLMAPLRTDAGKLRQILINLISNGIKFTDHGHVLVSIATEPNTNYPIRIDVSDTGIGIPPDKQSIIFDSFRQADNTTAHKYGGTGLGLTITAALCQLMGFRLNVCSEVSRGSTFSIWLIPDYYVPAAAATPLPASLPLHDGIPFPDPFQDRVVLVVADEEDALLLLTRLLEDLGCVPLPATSGEDALRLAHKIKPDVIILDLLMPETDGGKVLQTLKTNPTLQTLPVLLLTGKALSAPEKASLSRMASAVLIKSGEFKKELRQTLASILPKPQ